MALQRVQQSSALIHYKPNEEDFGAFIERIRRRSRVQIKEIAAFFPTYLSEQICGKKWDRFTYTHLVGERKRRPRIQELLPLYKCLVRAGVHFSTAERNHFLLLAWQIIEESAAGDILPLEGRWATLLDNFAAFDQLPRFPEQERPGLRPDGLRPVPRTSSLQEESRHLVGRDSWVRAMQKYMTADPPKKLVVIQAASGAGKSSVLHLLRRSLEEQGGYHLFFFSCATLTHMTADEYLERFLADTFAALGIEGESGEVEQPSLFQRTQLLLSHLAQTNTQTILFVDNGEVLLEEQGQLAPSWQQFFLDFVRYQHCGTLFFATKEWPGWKGRNRTYFVLNKLPPLSPEAGAEIWRRMGFDDVEESLLREVSIRCGGNPWLIELLRASTLQDMPLDTEDEVHLEQEDRPENAHTQLIKRLLRHTRTLFGNETDYETQQMLREVISTHLSPQALLLLDILARSPLALPLHALKDALPQVDEAFEELEHASLVDQDTKIYAQRTQLLPVVSEAALQRHSSNEHREMFEETLLQVYTRWLKEGIPSDQEKSAVIAELIVFSLTHLHLLDAAERFLTSSWLLARFGHAARIARMAYHVMERESWRSTAQQECGGLLLRHHLAPFLGLKIDAEARTTAYRHIYTALLQQQVHLQVPTELYVVHQLMALHRDALRYYEAQVLGTWSEYADEQKQREQAVALRTQAIAGYRQCITLWQQCEEREPAARRSSYKYRRARHLNDLGYYLRQQRRYTEALEAIQQSLDLKAAGYVEPGSLATGYSEKAQCLAALGKFRQALDFDQLAFDDIQQAAATGNSLLQEDVGVYLVERGMLYLRLGRVKEAETLLQQAHLSDDRRSHRTQAQDALAEIRQWRLASKSEQLDWRWSARYREIVRYDPFRWLTPTAFNPAEEEEWAQLQAEASEPQQKRLDDLIAHSRDREVAAAISEQREPRFRYPCIPIAEVTRKIDDLRTLAADISKDEPNAIVRRLYLDVIDEHISYLLMIQATREGDTQAFGLYNRAIHAGPTQEEMERALSHIARLISLGRQRADTAEASEHLAQFLKGIHAPLASLPTVESPAVIQKTTPSVLTKPHLFAPATIKRFFDAVMRDYGFDGWRTIIDSTANDPRIEQFTQELILPDKPLSVASVRSLLSHEIESHVFRAAAGAKSRLDLLSTGTRGFMATEEGLALYYDRKTALLQGKVMEEFSAGSLFGTLSTGLASGILTTPLTFSRLYAFLELALFLFRTVNGLDKDVQRARTRAQNLARQRCLRTFRGVPDLTVAGVAYLKDCLYYRGEQLVTAVIEQDSQKLTRLMVGVVGLEQLDDLEELGITEPPYQPQWLAHDPDLAEHILSFEVVSESLQA